MRLRRPGPPRLRRLAGLPVLLVVVLAVAPAPPAGAQPPRPVTPAELAGRFLEAARTAEPAASAPSPQRMAEVRARTGLPVDVAMGGERVRVPRDAVLEALEGDSPEDFRAAARRLRALGAAAGRGAAAEPLPGDVQAALGRAYRGIRTEPSLMDRIREAAARVFGRILELLGSALPGAGARWVPWAILAALVAGFLFLLMRMRVVPDRSASAGRESDPDVDWQAVADEAMARGDLRAAVRAHYRLLLAALNRKGLIEDVPSLTPAECRLALTSVSPPLAPAVADATGAFERAFYAGKAPTPEDVEAVRSARRKVLAA